MDEMEQKYRTMRDAYLKSNTTNTKLAAENEALALALRAAEEDWLNCSELWQLAAHNALSGWRARNPD